MATIKLEAGSFSLRLGHGAALTCPQHVIHYRTDTSLPPHTPPAAYWILPIAPIFPSSLLCNVRLRGPCFPAIELLQG